MYTVVEQCTHSSTCLATKLQITALSDICHSYSCLRESCFIGWKKINSTVKARHWKDLQREPGLVQNIYQFLHFIKSKRHNHCLSLSMLYHTLLAHNMKKMLSQKATQLLRWRQKPALRCATVRGWEGWKSERFTRPS